ncbi:nucleic-acid-binding protein from transposon X-element [Trichonephila clavipes]|nr:nucleic-acid-binding protein from transposon X-element [Trichonephila clavipes]
MAQMETDPPDITNSCEERNRLLLEIEALDIVINRCTELVNFPDADDNHEMKAILRASIDDTQRKKDTMETKTVLPFFQNTLPRNANNQKIFDLKTVGYIQVKIEGYLIRGITQCFNCNNFFHTVENCHLKPRCLKCGKEHPTRQCPIKERQENPFCINCQEYGHSACYAKCPKFPKPKKGTPLTANKTFESNVRREGVSFANIVSGTAPRSTLTPVHKLTEKTNENSNNKVSHGIQAIENENSDLAQVIELVSMISNIIKRSPEILQLLPKLKKLRR